MKKTTTYTITELRELIGGEAYKRALDWLKGQTGITEEETLIIESEEFGMTYYSNGKAARK